MGALSLRQTIPFIDLIALAGIGICAHFFGFVLNDLMDYSLDKESPYRQNSPLVSGEVTQLQAWVVMLVLELFAGLHTIRLLNLRHTREFRDVVLFLGGFYNYLALVIHVWVYLPLLIQIVLTVIMLQLLSIPFRRAWGVYRGRHKRIVRR